MDVQCYVAFSYIIIINSIQVQSENFLCGDKLEVYDANKSKCENGHVIPLNAYEDSSDNPFSETPAKYLCGPLYVLYDPSVYDCIDGKLVIKKNHHSTKEPAVSKFTDQAVKFIFGYTLIVISILTGFLLLIAKLMVKKSEGNDQCPV